LGTVNGPTSWHRKSVHDDRLTLSHVARPTAHIRQFVWLALSATPGLDQILAATEA
jgi:hypothetical protein